MSKPNQFQSNFEGLVSNKLQRKSPNFVKKYYFVAELLIAQYL